jgi:hepatocyte growth factor-regulated tyrosine kinase substrate
MKRFAIGKEWVEWAEGWKFPPVREAEAMFEADTAPEWADGEVCHR